MFNMFTHNHCTEGKKKRENDGTLDSLWNTKSIAPTSITIE